MKTAIDSVFPIPFIIIMISTCVAGVFVSGFQAVSAFIFCLLICWMIAVIPVRKLFKSYVHPAMKIPLTFSVGFISISFLYLIAKSLHLNHGSRFLFCIAPAVVGTICQIIYSNNRVPKNKNGSYLYIAVMGITLLCVTPVLQNVGAETEIGMAYRAYFNGDFLKHIALINECSKEGFPLQNPFFSNEPLHYYWLIYPFNALGANFPFIAPGAEEFFLLFTIFSGVLFVYTLWSLIVTLKLSKYKAFILLIVSLFAVSYEGLLLIIRIVSEHKPVFSELAHYNIDGYTRWIWGHPQIDGFHRSLIYTPQHLIAIIFLLIGIHLFETMPRSRNSFWQGIFVGAAVGISAFIGVLGSVAFLIQLIPLSWRERISGLSALFGWVLFWFLTKAFIPGGERLGFYCNEEIWKLGLILLVNSGILIIFAVKGLYRAICLKTNTQWLILLAVSTFFFLFIRMENNPSDVGMKSALLMNTILVLFIAKTFQKKSWYLPSIMCVLSIPAVLTMSLDYWNTRQISHSRYISYISNYEHRAAEWIQKNIDADAVMQAYPKRSPRGYFSFIPTFASHRVALGDPMHSRIFQINSLKLEQRREKINLLWKTKNPLKKLEIARELHIDYLFVGVPERQRFKNSLDKLHYFIKCYENPEISIYRLKPAIELIRLPQKNSIKIVNNEIDISRQVGVFRLQSGTEEFSHKATHSIHAGSYKIISLDKDDLVFLYPTLSSIGIEPFVDLTDPDFSNTGYRVVTSKFKGFRQATDLNSQGILAKKEGVAIPPGCTQVDLIYQFIGNTNSPPFWQIYDRKNQKSITRQILAENPSLDECLDVPPVTICSSEWLFVDIEVFYGGDGVLSIDALNFSWTPNFECLNDNAIVYLKPE